MNILIDFTQIPIQKVGVGVYAQATFMHLTNDVCDHKYFCLLQDDDKELENLIENSHTRIIKVKAILCRHFFLRFLMEQIYIPLICLINDIDLIHSLHYSFPLVAFWVKKVVTIHDLTFFIYPALHTFVKRYYFRFFTKLACRYADALICVSKSTEKDLYQYIHFVNAKVYVVPLAVNIPSLDFSNFDSLEKKYCINKKYFLFIGTLEPRKNIVNLIEAYSRLQLSNEYQLVIVGKKGWYYEEIFQSVRKNKLTNHVIFTGFVTDLEKYELLLHATIFIYPSVYEGFGLPVLEALSLGIPTITSNVSSMPEVAGDAAILVDPYKVDEIANAIQLLLNAPTTMLFLHEEGPKRAALFSWEKTAMNTLNVYNDFVL